MTGKTIRIRTSQGRLLVGLPARQGKCEQNVDELLNAEWIPTAQLPGLRELWSVISGTHVLNGKAA